jgi:hypothetical protein
MNFSSAYSHFYVTLTPKLAPFAANFGVTYGVQNIFGVTFGASSPKGQMPQVCYQS